MYIALLIIAILTILGVVTFKHPKFGRRPTGDRLAKIKQAPNYENGAFQNQTFTPPLTDGATYFSILKEALFERKKRVTPTDVIPSLKTDLRHLDINKDVLVWFGHSSYFIQLDGKRMLVDPVFCGHASPFSFSVKAFPGANNYSAADMPDLDYLFISHDHWDHLDYETVKKLQPRVKQVICSLGTGEHLEYWGYSRDQIVELNWYDQVVLGGGFTVHAVPGRHFSGRGFKRNQAVWTSFALLTPTMKIFIGGDSGYDKHFAEAGAAFGQFDLAILENGQYNKSWKHIHMLPGEMLKAARDLNAKRLLTVHNSKFSLANHPWDEPLINISTQCKAENMPLLTPKIGEQVNLKDNNQVFSEWWVGIN